MNNNIENELEDNSEYWEDLMATFSDVESAEAKFDVITSRVNTVIKDWLHTPVWAATPDNPTDPLRIRSQKFDNANPTRLGEVAAVSILGLLAMLCLKSDTKLDPRVIFQNKETILEVIGTLMVEGVMVANSPGWSAQMDDALADVRESRWQPMVVGADSRIIEERDSTTEDKDSPGSTEA
jgi:hypothetical protein